MNSNDTLSSTRWQLTDLFPAPDSAEINQTFADVEQKAKDFETARQQLNEHIPQEKFIGLIRRLEEISRQAQRIGSYAHLWFSEDTQNQAALSLLARTEQFAAHISNRLLFFSLWWKDLPDQAASRLMEGSGGYRYWLEEMRHFKPYTLSESEEKVINIKDVTGANAITTLYSTITNRYTFKLKIEGKTRQLTRGELMVFARSADPDLRRTAYRELYRVYGKDAPILGQIYQTLVRDWRNENVNLRRFSSPVAVRNLANDIPDEVIDTLLDVCQRNAPLFQRFFRLKARRLGVERLRRYDIYAPVTKSEKHYSYEQAYGIVMDAFQMFEPHFAEQARHVFDRNHVDSQVRKGKHSGAYCLTALPDLPPWVLLNYQGKAEDVATMAHELGHAVHSMLASQHNLFTFHPCLPLAETASTFGEMLLVDRLLAAETDPAVRRDLLFRQVDDSYATILRQAYFALFEKRAHEIINQGATVDELASTYISDLRQQFGDAVEVSDEFRWEWVSIPHIYNSPFYVYAYAFGQLLVLSFYRRYLAEGESFKPRYLRLLQAGGSRAPLNLLAEAGVNAQDPLFWQGGFDVINDLVDQLEKMV